MSAIGFAIGLGVAQRPGPAAVPPPTTPTPASSAIGIEEGGRMLLEDGGLFLLEQP